MLFRSAGAILAEVRAPAPSEVDALVHAIGAQADVLIPTHGVRAVGVGTAGMIDHDGAVRYAPNLPMFVDVPLRALLAERLVPPVVVDNDANAAAWGEHCHGAARGVDTPNFYDTALVTIRFASGAVGSISGVCPCDYGYDARVEIVGERGILQIGELRGQAVVICTSRDQGLVSPIYRTWPERFAAAYVREMRHFLDCIRSGSSPRVTGEDGRWAVAGVLAATASLLEDRPVRLSEVLEKSKVAG